MTTEQRLERLERENRWMRRMGAVGVTVAAAVFLIGQGKDKELPDLVVRSLTVKDSNGRSRARLFLQAGALAGEEPVLTMEDPHGTGAYVSPGGLGVTGAGGKSSVGIGLSNHRDPGLHGSRLARGAPRGRIPAHPRAPGCRCLCHELPSRAAPGPPRHPSQDDRHGAARRADPRAGPKRRLALG